MHCTVMNLCLLLLCSIALLSGKRESQQQQQQQPLLTVSRPNNSTLMVMVSFAGAQGLSLRDVVQQMQRTGPSRSSSSGINSHISSSGSSTEVLHLPGAKHGLPSKHYAGYVTVDDATARQLYYYLVTHEKEGGSAAAAAAEPASTAAAAADDNTPLIVWLTGGPGCSSMDAFTYEHGPFKFTAPAAEAAGRDPTLRDIQLNPNPFSWSKTAHVLYIDSPAGTGFSYTPGETSYHSSDDKAIRDLEVFLRGFFEEHPWLKQQPLYIAGESYGGVYVPLLARALLHHNQRLQAATGTHNRHSGSVASRPLSPGPDEEYYNYNLAGYIVGNAVTDEVYDGVGQVEFAFDLGLIDPDTYHTVKQTCKANGWHLTEPHSPCTAAIDQMEARMGPVNHYDILGRCYKPGGDKHQQQQQQPHSPLANRLIPQAESSSPAARAADYQLFWSSRKLQQQQLQQPPRFSQQAGEAAAMMPPAGGMRRRRAAQQLQHAVSCADRRYASVYYNTAEVRKALHAASQEQAGRWEPCSDVLHYAERVGSMIPVHRELIEAGVKALVLSGDHDYVVPYQGTRAWVYDLGLKQAKTWHSWSLPGDDQVAGYAVEFTAGLTFASVKGGGHMVPQTHPEAALALVKQWLQKSL